MDAHDEIIARQREMPCSERRDDFRFAERALGQGSDAHARPEAFIYWTAWQACRRRPEIVCDVS